MFFERDRKTGVRLPAPPPFSFKERIGMKRLLPLFYAIAILISFKVCVHFYKWKNPDIPGFISVLDDNNGVATIEFNDFYGIYPSGCDRTFIKTKNGKYIKIQLPYKFVEDVYARARYSVGLGYDEI